MLDTIYEVVSFLYITVLNATHMQYVVADQQLRVDSQLCLAYCLFHMLMRSQLILCDLKVCTLFLHLRMC